jgi:signal transduction histidine kinase
VTAVPPPVRPAGVTRRYALAGASVLLGAGLLASIYQDRLFHSQRVRELTAQGEILAASVTAAIVFGDVKTVQEHVDALLVNPQIAAAGVYGSAGNLVAGRGRGAELPRSLRGRNSSGQTDVVVPVTHQNERLGSVYIASVDEPLWPRLSRHLPMMLLAVMAALLVSFMGASQRALSEANRQLASRAEALADANRLLQTEMEERSRAEDALRQSQKMEALGRLAGGVAHDFNNLLTIIQGNLHLMSKTDPADHAAIQAHVAAAKVASDRAGQVIRRLLAFSRRQPLSPRPVDLSELASGMKDLIGHSVGDGVRLQWDLNATWKTMCDVNQMEAVILNLAINARDAMPEGGNLTIRTVDCPLNGSDGDVPPGDYVELTMRDSGTGMTEEVRNRALDPFFTTKPHGKGTGLGLSMAFAFVRQSNGYLTIETAPGRGTSIVILLPRYDGVEAAGVA